MQRVLFFSPYSAWHYHAQVELTLAQALQLRGAEVSTVLCDGRFGACDIYRENLNPRGASACGDCQARQLETWGALERPPLWLAERLPPGSEALVQHWAAALQPSELESACFQGRPVGAWALSSALYQTRRSSTDLAEDACVRALRQGVRDTALALLMVEALYDEIRPDVVVLLNGRFFPHRVAVELARERGLRFIAHERGARRNGLMLHANRIIHDLQPYSELWEAAKDVTLLPAQVQRVHSILDDRRHGKGLSWSAYSPPPEESAQLRLKLGLDARPVAAIFGSSDDEVAAFPAWSAGAFPAPFTWMDGVLELARQRPQVQFVLRLHPALEHMGGSAEGLRAAAERCARAPHNLRVVQPSDDISSYTLGDIADVALVTLTTMGLELAAQGKPVLALARGWYGHCAAVDLIERREDLPRALDAALERGCDAQRARLATRFLHAYYSSMTRDFPLVREEPRHHGQPAYSEAAELGPGLDPELDRLCALILSGRSVELAPTAEQPGREPALELEALEQAVPALRRGAPAPAQGWTLRAEQLWSQGDGEGSLAALEHALALDPGSARAWNDLGVVQSARGLTEQARQSFQLARACPGGSLEAEENLALLHSARSSL